MCLQIPVEKRGAVGNIKAPVLPRVFSNHLHGLCFLEGNKIRFLWFNIRHLKCGKWNWFYSPSWHNSHEDKDQYRPAQQERKPNAACTLQGTLPPWQPAPVRVSGTCGACHLLAYLFYPLYLVTQVPGDKAERQVIATGKSRQRKQILKTYLYIE